MKLTSQTMTLAKILVKFQGKEEPIKLSMERLMMAKMMMKETNEYNYSKYLNSF